LNELPILGNKRFIFSFRKGPASILIFFFKKTIYKKNKKLELSKEIKLKNMKLLFQKNYGQFKKQQQRRGNMEDFE